MALSSRSVSFAAAPAGTQKAEPGKHARPILGRVATKGLAADGLYRTDHHLAVARAQAVPGRDPAEVVAAHVRRLEALRRAGIVERLAEGVWQVPADLPEQGRQYDTQRAGGVAVELKSHLPIERQARVIGATWLDQQLMGGGEGLGEPGFGSEVRSVPTSSSNKAWPSGAASASAASTVAQGQFSSHRVSS